MARAKSIEDRDTRRFAVLSPIGIHDEDGKFVILKVGQLVDLTKAEHEELFALGAVAEDSVDPAGA